MNKTIDYYNTYADDFYNSTIDADMSPLYNMFEKRLPEGACILDLGCGSGRDSKYFLEQGYKVTAIDGSEELCKKASELTGLDVKKVLFSQIKYKSKFDGIWACASLLHVELDKLPSVLMKVSNALKDGGILYASFKYGDFCGERNGRLFTDLNEELFDDVISSIPELSIIERYITEDVRPDREESWLNLIIAKNQKAELKTIDEHSELKEIEKVRGEIVIDRKGSKVLKIAKNMEGVDFLGTVDKVAQYVNIANIVKNIEKGAEYVVQIPAKYRDAFEAGEVFLNKNKTTGVEWPTLMRKADNGQYRFVDDLPIKQQEFIKGNPFQDICNSYHNIVMQQQLAEISRAVEETYKTVKRIEQGQQDDRIALIDAARKQVLVAMTLQDENEKRAQLQFAARDLMVGKEQIGKALKRRVDAFEALPDTKFSIFFATLTKPGYLSKKDDEIEGIQECYSMYLEATKMLAAIYAYKGETSAVETVFDDSVEYLKQINFKKLKSIETSHSNQDMSDWFFNQPVKYFENEKKPCLESSKGYDYIQLEMTGEELMEALNNGR